MAKTNKKRAYKVCSWIEEESDRRGYWLVEDIKAEYFAIELDKVYRKGVKDGRRKERKRWAKFCYDEDTGIPECEDIRVLSEQIDDMEGENDELREELRVLKASHEES